MWGSLRRYHHFGQYDHSQIENRIRKSPLGTQRKQIIDLNRAILLVFECLSDRTRGIPLQK